MNCNSVLQWWVFNFSSLDDLIDGLSKNGLHNGYSHLLTGYVRNESFLFAVLNVVADLKRSNPGIIYGWCFILSILRVGSVLLRILHTSFLHFFIFTVSMLVVCDPVMGDDGIVYIPEELIPVYRDKVIPLADIITPNQTELEWVF